MILAERWICEKVEAQDRYFITSLDNDAEKIPSAKCSQWEIENSLHCCLILPSMKILAGCGKIMLPKTLPTSAYGSQSA
jgi:hypothetical protein